MIEPEDIRNLLPKRSRFGHKGTYGKVLVIAGSEDMCGAAFLSAKAAYIMIYRKPKELITLEKNIIQPYVKR